MRVRHASKEAKYLGVSVCHWQVLGSEVRVTRRPLLPGHDLFSRPKKCRVSKIQDFASSDIYVSLGLSQTSYYALTRFGKGISLTFYLLARALTVERTVNGRKPCQCWQMYDNYPLNTIILSLWYDTPFPIWQH